LAEQQPLSIELDAIDKGNTGRTADRDQLREYLHDPAFRAIEGFPLGDDEAILALSDPPYYTACPNPFLPEILEQWQAERAQLRQELDLPDDAVDNGDAQSSTYHGEPFASDVSEGKGGAIYNAHGYHTKVPHKAVMRYILHYTDPGDVVLDGFCGTGMTGVAAQLCADRREVAELGYRVDEEGLIYDSGEAVARLGTRQALLVDLSPAATFIAYNYNTPVNANAFRKEANRILRKVENELDWMYETWHPHCDHSQRIRARIHYTVWSDVFKCPECGAEMVFWDVAVDEDRGLVRDDWPCPGCQVILAKDPKKKSRAIKIEPAMETKYDLALKETVRQIKQAPVLINYSVGRKRYEKRPDADDLARIQRIQSSKVPYWFPIDRMPEGDESRRNDDIGITHVHHFYTTRNLWILAALWHNGRNPTFRWLVSSIMQRASKQHQIAISRVGGEKKGQPNRILRF